jgi:hypothetical protein
LDINRAAEVAERLAGFVARLRGAADRPAAAFLLTALLEADFAPVEVPFVIEGFVFAMV